MLQLIWISFLILSCSCSLVISKMNTVQLMTGSNPTKLFTSPQIKSTFDANVGKPINLSGIPFLAQVSISNSFWGNENLFTSNFTGSLQSLELRVWNWWQRKKLLWRFKSCLLRQITRKMLSPFNDLLWGVVLQFESVMSSWWLPFGKRHNHNDLYFWSWCCFHFCNLHLLLVDVLLLWECSRRSGTEYCIL